MNIIVIINGLGGSGKSTFCSQSKASFINKVKSPSLSYELSTVDFVKEVATFCGWRGEKEPKDRAFLHDLKMALEEWNDIPNKKTQEIIEQFMELPYENRLFFVNIRETKGIDSFKKWALNEKKYKVFTVFVTNPNIISNEAKNVKDEMLDYDYDFVISNDGDILDLQKKADEFISNICCERT